MFNYFHSQGELVIAVGPVGSGKVSFNFKIHPTKCFKMRFNRSTFLLLVVDRESLALQKVRETVGL